MNIAFTYRNISIALLLIAAAFLISPVAHAQVSEEELAVLQVQVDEATAQVNQIASQGGKVLGVSTTDWAKQLESLRAQIMSTGLKTSPAGETTATTQGGKKEALKRQIAAYDKQIEHFTKLRDEAKAKLAALEDEDEDTSGDSKKTFTIKDVKSVTAQYVDPITTAADDEYTLFTITLKSGKVVKVKQCGFCLDRDAAFKKAGYSGKVEELRKMATKIEETKGSPKFIKVDEDDSAKKVTVTVYARKNVAAGVPVVMGPITLGTITWGDNSTKENVTGLYGQKSVTLKHTYSAKGTYTIKLTDDYGTASTKVVIGDGEMVPVPVSSND